MDPIKPSGSSSSSSVSSRFVSQTELEEAQKRRKEEIRATYERIGQEPPPEIDTAEDAPYDSRSLYERIKANKDAKQEAFEAQTKLSAQFRGIDDAESAFLEQVAREKRAEARQKEDQVRKELEEYRRVIREKEEEEEKRRLALQKKEADAAAAAEASAGSSALSPSSKSGHSADSKTKKGKRKREGLLGIVRKKPAVEGGTTPAGGQITNTVTNAEQSKEGRGKGQEKGPAEGKATSQTDRDGSHAAERTSGAIDKKATTTAAAE